MTPKYVKGGIGDMLQTLESAVVERNISVYSHFAKAPDIYAPYRIKLIRFEYFKKKEDLNTIFFLGEPLTRKHYFDSYPTFPTLAVRPKGRRILGIHIEGSEFSNNTWSKLGCPTKNMSASFLGSLFGQLSHKERQSLFIYIFCAPERTGEIGDMFAKLALNHFYVISFPNIWHSLSCVSHCDAVLGMDSSIKTMSSMLRIPTTVLVGDYEDPFRDETFLTPYINDGVMNIVKYKNIDDINPADVLNLVNL